MDDIRKRIEEFKASMEKPRADAVTRAKPATEQQKVFDEYMMAQQEAKERLLSELPGRAISGAIPGAVGALAGFVAQYPGMFGDLRDIYETFKPESAPNVPEILRALPTTERLQEFYMPEDASPEMRAGMTGGNAVAIAQGVAAIPGMVKGVAKGAPKVLGNLIDEILAPRVGAAGQRGAVGYRDPSATKIADWKWRDIEDVKKDVPLTEVPDYIQGGYGQFLKDQAQKASNKELTERDLLKAYLITQSSIGRGGLPYSTATKTGLKLPNASEIRPEGAFATWLGSPQGQRYLAAAERGEIDPRALEDIRQKFAPFGKQNQLVNQMADAVKSVQAMTPRLNEAITGSADDYRDFAEQLRGIAAAKSGFVGSLLGRGDLPTFDARQIGLHTKDMPMPTASVGSMLSRGKGLGGREAVDRLTARQEELGLKIDPALAPHYQHLTHHAVWDALGGEKTTHKDLIEAMKNYANGGPVSQDAMNIAVMNQKVQKRGAGGVMRGFESAVNVAKELKRLKEVSGLLEAPIAGQKPIGEAQRFFEMAKNKKPDPILASKAFDPYLGEKMALTPSVADRMIARPGKSREKGGPMFSWLSTVDPNYEGWVWANKGKAKSSQMIGMAKENPGLIFAPQFGTSDMHRSNQVTFEKIIRAFNRSKEEGNLTPELHSAYNERLKSFYKNQETGDSLFNDDFDVAKITSKMAEGMTFPQRAAIAEVLGGKGLRDFGYKRQEKAQIIPYQKILESTIEPSLIEAPTGSVGPRLFTLSGERIIDPKLHSAFPEIVGGTDLKVQYKVAPRDIVAHDFVKQIEQSKGRPPGHMDWDRNSIIMDINREMIQRLEDAGYKKGGKVTKKADGGLTSDDLILEERGA